MGKILNKFLSVFVGAAIMASAVPAAPLMAYAATTESPDPSGLTLNPVVFRYDITNSKGKAIDELYSGNTFNMKLTIKDIKVKTSQLPNKEKDIDFLKSMDSFKGDFESLKVISKGDELLIYEVVLKNCKWTGGSNSFGFMVGYSGGNDYSSSSVNITECTEKSADNDDPVINVAEPTIMISAVQPDEPIKAGEEGEFRITLKNLGMTAAYNMLAEISSSDDILVVDGTGTQDIDSLGIKQEKSLVIKYRALDKITSLKQSFSVSLRYYYDNGSAEVSGSANGQVSVAAEVSTIKTVYPVINATFDLTETEIEGGREYNGQFLVKNIGTADMKGIFASFSGSDDIIISGGSGYTYFDSIPVNQQRIINVKFRTMKEITALRQEIKLALKYTYTMGSEDQNADYEQSFIMFGKGAGSAPLPVITSKPFSSALEAGKSYRKSFYITNKGTEDMVNVTVKVKSSDGLTITDGREQFFVDKIKAGAEKRILVYFNTNAELTAVNQTLDVDIEYYYQKAGTLTAETKSGTVTMNSAISSAPVLRISGENLGTALVPDTEYEYAITVKNYGDITVRDVFIDFTSTDALYFLDGTEAGHIDIIRPKDTATIKVKFKTLEDIASVKQGITAEMKYSYGRNTSIIQKDGTSSITLIAAANKGEDGKDNAAAPNIIIGRYDIGADQIAAGDIFTLSLDFYNTNPSTGIENLIMTVNASGDLSIYGGSNSFYYPTLAAAGSASESVQLRALPTATTGTSSVTVSFKYDYVTGETRNTMNSEQSIYVPLYQPDKMTFSVSKPTYDVYTGNEVYLTLSYMNKGRSDAANVKVELVSGSSSGDNANDGNVDGGVVPTTGEAVDNGSSAGEAVSTGSGNDAALLSDIAMDAASDIMYDGAMGNAGYIDDGYVDGGYDMGGDMSYEDPGFTALSTEKVIGNVTAGGNGTADFIVTPTRSGELTVIFRITYEDSNMNEIVKELPVTFNVQEQQWVEPDYPMTYDVPDEGGEGFPWWAWLIIGGGVAVVAVVVIIIVVKKKKKNGGKKKYTADDIDWEDDFDDSDKSDSSDSSDKTTKV